MITVTLLHYYSRQMVRCCFFQSIFCITRIITVLLYDVWLWDNNLRKKNTDNFVRGLSHDVIKKHVVVFVFFIFVIDVLSFECDLKIEQLSKDL